MKVTWATSRDPFLTLSNLSPGSLQGNHPFNKGILGLGLRLKCLLILTLSNVTMGILGIPTGQEKKIKYMGLKERDILSLLVSDVRKFLVGTDTTFHQVSE